MLKYETGMLVRSLAGHDKERLYIIIEEREKEVVLADGRIRSIDRPKCKKKTHVQLIGKKMEENLFADEAIRSFIKKYQAEIM